MEIRITYTVEQVIEVPDDLSEEDIDEIVAGESMNVNLNEFGQTYEWNYNQIKKEELSNVKEKANC